ncbi:hypothetical protein D9758_006418 [Tetrapyrgos nigripes]|uniref:Uncharacterized protein n=1 Tax=Tetrapyrgos nigripes TaxID=182062 RepID=A0A8H5D8K3_9AGAR|nr:hypothetical protein D9758_006418 [Tetrapyrgos nigripes]
MLQYFWTVLALITAFYPYSLPTHFERIGCVGDLASKSLEQVVDCLDEYTVGPDHYNEQSYASAQPNLTELTAFIDLVTSLLYVDGNCTSLRVPASLAQHFQISLFSESEVENNSYCILYEHTSWNSSYVKGWGFMAVPASRPSNETSTLHLSVPHPAYDLHTPQQATALFSRTRARSLFITGRSRLALRNSTSCIQSDRTTYYVTDPCHDNHEPFHVANLAIYRWQQANGGCPSSTCAFIQMHGKGPSTCPTDQVFLSSGLARSSSSAAWYTDDVDRPIKRLKANLQLAFPSWNISMPSDSSCILTATSNVFGRFVNGIDASQVCTTESNASLTTGEFVHIEQARISREVDSHDGWIRALRETFGMEIVNRD